MSDSQNPEIIRPYLVYPAALDQGLFDPTHVSPESLITVRRALEGLLNGYMPDRKAGLVDIHGQIGAIDLVTIGHQTDSELVVLPTDKSKVNGEDGRFNGSDTLVMTSPSGWMRVIGETVQLKKLLDWPTPETRTTRQRVSRQRTQGTQGNPDHYVFVPTSMARNYHPTKICDDGTVYAR